MFNFRCGTELSNQKLHDVFPTCADAEYEEKIFAPLPELNAFNPELGANTVEGGEPPVELRPNEKRDPSDPSVLVPHLQNTSLAMSLFEQGLAVYADTRGMSRSDYTALRELLALIKAENGETHPAIARLPMTLDSIKHHLRSRLPLPHMRKVEIPLKVQKLPTDTATRKRDFKGKAKQGKNDMKQEVVMSTLHFIDPTSLFQSIVSSDILSDMHTGPALFVDEPTELFHSHAWASSVRASSGKYAHLKFGDKNGAAVLPSDFVYYRCLDEFCACQYLGEFSPLKAWHIGRVYGFGFDRRAIPCTTNQDELVVQIQEGFHRDGIFMPATIRHQIPSMAEEEIILISDVTYIPESRVWGHATVYVDRLSGETHEDPGPSETFIKKVQHAAEAAERATKRQQEAQARGENIRVKIPKIPEPYPKYLEAPTTARSDSGLFVRYIAKDGRVVALCHSHPIRAELEMEAYDRHTFVSEWDTAVDGVIPTIACPLLTFIDGFGIYRNSYRTLMGVYVVPAGLSENDRTREANFFPIALGPHGSDFGDVVKALQSMRYLDEGTEAFIHGKQHRLCVFTMCYTGDMPQQAENSGFKHPRGHKFCRFCFIGSKSGGDNDADAVMGIDLDTHGRYHHQTRQMQVMYETLGTNKAKEEFGTQWGISNPNPPLTSISPASDLILSRPPDPAHSEYSGISSLMHFLLRDAILTPAAGFEYAATLRSWPFPPGCPRLMSPLHHLPSYDLSSHARWSIIVPVLLRDWLKPSHIMPRFHRQAEKLGDPVTMVVSTCAAIAKSNSILMGRKISKSDRENLEGIVRNARSRLNQLNVCASKSVQHAPTSIEDVAAVTTSKRAAKYLSDTMRPNVHLGIHFSIFAEEYALPKNINTLEGENFHR